MEIQEQRQATPIEDPVGSLVAVTRPILVSIMQSIGAQYLDAYEGDRGIVPLKMLGRLRAEGDGDTGIAFEYAIHDAVRTENAGAGAGGQRPGALQDPRGRPQVDPLRD